MPVVSSFRTFLFILALFAPFSVANPPVQPDGASGDNLPHPSTTLPPNSRECSLAAARFNKRTIGDLHYPRHTRHGRWAAHVAKRLSMDVRKEPASRNPPDPITYNIFPFATERPTPTAAFVEDVNKPSPSAEPLGPNEAQVIQSPLKHSDMPSKHKIVAIVGGGAIIALIFFILIVKLTRDALRKPRAKNKSTGAIEWRMSFSNQATSEKRAPEAEEISNCSTESFQTATSTHTNSVGSALPRIKKPDASPSSPSKSSTSMDAAPELPIVVFDPPCAPAPAFPPPVPPMPLVPIRYAELLSPMANLAAHNQTSARGSLLPLGSSISDPTVASESPPHKRTQSVPESILRRSAARSLASDDGYWDMLDLLTRPESGSESDSVRLSGSTTRSSRSKSESEVMVSSSKPIF
ncbi:hypothetical protein K488DRAFT_81496 [Vararia minispora EC-137]|uniref:Uncharacterized protein n=1 Tax=Vararia minispora EC-137 TaxID=1314806 RepID=A0ACB8QYR1_9AGAM|nr:hypothetical protein K488DRAFT_81496 [Vararia minispora EC-137]